jgi:hypothetical protein
MYTVAKEVTLKRSIQAVFSAATREDKVLIWTSPLAVVRATVPGFSWLLKIT